jgi:hypothetical protein
MVRRRRRPAASQSPFPITTPDLVVDAATEYLQGSETAIVSSIGEVLAFGASVVHAVGTIFDIADAYTTCAVVVAEQTDRLARHSARTH